MGLNFLLLYYRRPEIRNVYIFMGAKKTVQQTMPIRPDFAQVAGTLLDPQLRHTGSFWQNVAPFCLDPEGQAVFKLAGQNQAELAGLADLCFWRP